ncbi:MAG: metallophosphoesterase [Nanoarchaeota archaeon]|nr:metallophosphoesterase [Nanoarchaeota archaeon]
MSEDIIPGARALLVKDEGVKILVIADLHLKDEDDVVYSLIDKTKSLVKKHKPDILLIAGDIFDFGTGGASVELFEAEISKIVNTKIIMGNHDPDIFPLYLTTNNYVFCHGEFDFKLPQKNLVMAHTHSFLDNKPVFLKGVLKDGRNFTIIPPFNSKVGGPDIKEKHLLLGFVFNNELIKECLVYNLDGKKIAKLN